MNVLILNSARKYIGEAAHCVDLYNHLRRIGHNPMLVVRKGSLLDERLNLDGVEHKTLNFSSGFHPALDYSDRSKLKAWIADQNTDVLHVHRGKDHWLAALAVRGNSRPAIVRTRHTIVPVRDNIVNRWLFRNRADRVIAVSQKAAASYGSLLPLIRHKLQVVYSSVDTSGFHAAKRSESWRASIGVGQDELLVGLVARLQRIKGQEEFIRAARQVAEAVPNARFLIAGSGDEEKIERTRAWIEASGIADRIIMTGWLDDIQTVIASLDVGVLASLGSEGSSRITYEYMASEVPVVATAVGCIPEIVTHDHTGIVVEPGDVSGLADAVIRVLQNPAEGDQLKTNALRRIQGFHNRDRWIQETVHVYEQAVARESVA